MRTVNYILKFTILKAIEISAYKALKNSSGIEMFGNILAYAEVMDELKNLGDSYERR